MIDAVEKRQIPAHSRNTAMEPKPAPASSIPLWIALLPIVVLIGLLILNVRLYGDEATYGSNQIALLLAAATAAVLGMILRQPFSDMLDGIIGNLTSAMSAMLLLLLIGSLTGTWMISGIVPAMIYYGLDLLSPSVFLAASVVICSIVSLATGSSWSTVATVGIALLGIGQALGVSEAMAAGAIISGAYFGDKLSPLSDTTNLASAMAGSELFAHVRYMLYTTVPSILLTILIFAALGLTGERTGAPADTQLLQAAIDERFNINGWLFLVPIAVLAMVVMRVNAIAALFMGVILGGVFAVIFQPTLVRELSGLPNRHWTSEPPYVLHAYSTVVKAMALETSAVSSETIAQWEAERQSLLESSRPEIEQRIPELEARISAANTIWLIVTAMCFGGVMEACGFLRRITQPLVGMARTDGSLIATTAGSCMFVNATASDQYLAIVVPGRMFRETYAERGLHPTVLSRTLEDSGTVTSVLVPWNTCGAAQQGVLGVSVYAFAPWCLFNIISPLMTMAFGFLGIRIARIAAANADRSASNADASDAGER
jgi:NhaC family Na+:H+ antiporter